MKNQLIKNQIIQHSEIDERIKEIAQYNGKSSMMHFTKLVKQLASEINKNGLGELLFNQIENGMNRVYRAKRNAYESN